MHQDHHGYVCLLIQGATKDDAGWYTVSAKNEAGIVSCTARLDVYSKYLPVLGARGLPVRTACAPCEPRTGLSTSGLG